MTTIVAVGSVVLFRNDLIQYLITKMMATVPIHHKNGVPRAKTSRAQSSLPQPFGDSSIVFHSSRQIKGSDNIDNKNISRAKGMFGGEDYEMNRFPNSVHHFKIFTNSSGKARVFYQYKATNKSITFLKVKRSKI